MRKHIIKLYIIVVLSIIVLLSGCANQVLYGPWQLSDTIDANTMQSLGGSNDMFSSLMVFKINRDGTVTFLDQPFGTFEKSRNEFAFTYTTKEGEPEKIETGAYELNGTTLRIWVDQEPVIYSFVRVEENEE